MKIPDYQPMQVAPGAVRAPSQRVTMPSGAEAITQGMGQLGNLGGAALDAYKQYEHQQQVKQAQDLDTKYTRVETESMHGGVTPGAVDNGPVPDVTKMSDEGFASFLEGPDAKRTPGYLETRGDFALPAFDPAMKDLEKKRQAIADEATDPAVRDMFLKSTASRYESTYRQAEAHLAGQLREAQVDSVKNGLAAITSAASLSPGTDPENEARITAMVAGLAGRAAALATSKEDADAKVDAIQAHVATARAGVLMKQAEENPLLWDAAEKVVKGSEKALGRQSLEGGGTMASALLDKIRDGRAGADVQATAASIATAARSDQIFRPLDLDKVAELVAAVPKAKRKNVARAVNELIGNDARRVKANKERFVDSAKTQYIEQRAAFFNTTTAKVLHEVDPDAYFALEDRLRSASLVARTEGMERKTLQSKLDASALEDLKDRLDENPNLDVNKFMAEHPEVDPLKRNHFNAVASKAAKVHEKGLTPSQNQYAAQFVRESRHKMPTFSGTIAQVKAQETKWLKERHDQGADLYVVAMDENEGEAPDPKVLLDKKATAIVDLPLSPTNPQARATDVKAIVNRGAPPPVKPPPPPGIRATGRTAVDAEGNTWAEMSDGSKQLVPSKKAKK